MNTQKTNEISDKKTPSKTEVPNYPEIPVTPLKVGPDFDTSKNINESNPAEHQVETPATMPNELYKEILPPDTRVIS